MKFPKDILVIDFEGGDAPVQFGGVLLDRETLAEKKAFSTYIFADLGGGRTIKSGITQEMLVGAPLPAAAGRMIVERLGTDYTLACWVANKDIAFFKQLMDIIGFDWGRFDYHVLDIWPVAYLHLLREGYTGGSGSDDMFRAFGLPERGLHDALEDARLAATVLRRLAS
jgi:DNA polymerase III epsilon subunit-like protein